MQPPRIAALAALSILGALRALHAQRPTDQGAFITRLGVDTVAVEGFTRTSNRVEGDIAIRNPRTRTVHYIATLGPTGTITHFEMTSVFVSAPAGTPPMIERATDVTDTLLTTDVRRNGVRDTTASGTAVLSGRGAVPFVQSAIEFYDQAVHQLQQSGRDSITVQQYTFGPNHTFPSYIRRFGRDSVEINIGIPLYGKVDRDGHLVGLSARATTVKTETVRAPFSSLTSTVAAWTARERSGVLAGAVSGRDTVRATVGSAELWLDYGRPLRRGRTVFGALVPWDTVWRTGANAATQFRTSVDVVIGDAPVPAGTYTLWTIPSRAGATLIVNKQSGQWGTQYDSTQDLVRVPLRVTNVAQPIETFTMEVPSATAASSLRFKWDMREFSVPIREVAR